MARQYQIGTSTSNSCLIDLRGESALVLTRYGNDPLPTRLDFYQEGEGTFARFTDEFFNPVTLDVSADVDGNPVVVTLPEAVKCNKVAIVGDHVCSVTANGSWE